MASFGFSSTLAKVDFFQLGVVVVVVDVVADVVDDNDAVLQEGVVFVSLGFSTATTSSFFVTELREDDP